LINYKASLDLVPSASELAFGGLHSFAATGEYKKKWGRIIASSGESWLGKPGVVRRAWRPG